jgi:hypothetical protein
MAVPITSHCISNKMNDGGSAEDATNPGRPVGMRSVEAGEPDVHGAFDMAPTFDGSSGVELAKADRGGLRFDVKRSAPVEERYDPMCRPPSGRTIPTNKEPHP